MPAEVVYDWLLPGDPALEFAHLGVLIVVLGCLEAGRSTIYGAQVEGEGARRELVLGRGSEVAKFDPPGFITGSLSQIFRHLAANGLLTFSEQGGERRVGYGPRLLEAWRAEA